MGLFGSHGRDPAFGDRLRAAIAYMNGDTAAAGRFQALQLQRQEEARQQAAADRAVQQRDEQIWGAKEQRIPNSVISATTPADLSQITRERNGLQRFDAAGGSMWDPLANNGQGAWSLAPSEREVNGAIIRTNPQGQSDVRYDGGHVVPITEGGGAAIVNSRGQGGWLVRPDGLPDAPGPPPGLGPRPLAGAPQMPASPAQVAPQQGGAMQPPAAQLGGLPDPRAVNDPAPAFNPDPNALAAAPPVASYRGIEFSPPLANMPRIGRRAPTGNSRAAQARQAARSAINRGAPRDAVRARLRSIGVSDRGL